MKINCDIIRDILPLYAEDMVSDATREMVDEHLCGCDACTKELGALKKTEKVPVEVDISSLKRVGDSIRRRRILAVLTVLLFIGTILLGGALLLDARIYLSADQAVKDIYTEGSAVRIVWSDMVIGMGSMSVKEDTGNYGVIAWSNLRTMLFPTEKVPYDQLTDDVKALITEEEYSLLDNTSTYDLENGCADTNFWYCSPKDGMPETLLLDAGKSHTEIPLTDVNYHLAYYCIGLVVLCAACALLGRRFTNRWYGELASRVAILLGSLAISVVIVSAGQFMELWGEFTECFIDSTAVAVPMCLTGLLARHLHKLNRQDKGL